MRRSHQSFCHTSIRVDDSYRGAGYGAAALVKRRFRECAGIALENSGDRAEAPPSLHTPIAQLSRNPTPQDLFCSLNLKELFSTSCPKWLV